MKLFHHSAAFIEKHKRHHHVVLATLALIIAASSVYIYRHELAHAATFTWKQTSWAGGVSGSTTAHNPPQGSFETTGWTNFSATSSTSVLASASGVSLAVVSKTLVDGGFATTTPAGNSQQDVAIDASGNMYTFHYTGGNTYVAKTTPGGSVNLIWAQLSVGSNTGPTSIVIDSVGNLYVANSAPGTISKITPAGGNATTPWVSLGATVSPRALVFDTMGNLYSANYLANTVSKITSLGATTTYATLGAGTNPYALAFDAIGNLYTANPGNSTISKITPERIVSTYATLATNTGPHSLAFDASGNLYTANFGTGCGSGTTVSKVAADRSIAQSWATVGAAPEDLVFDPAGNLYVANYGCNGAGTTISKITFTAPGVKGLVSTFATLGAVNMGPKSLVIDSAGVLYSANSSNSTVSKLRLTGGFEVGANTSTVVTGTSVGLGAAALATGGTITASGGYTIHTFTSGGNFVLSSPASVEYLVVAGGGAAGCAGIGCGGGGAGGMLSGVVSNLSAQTYGVTVGLGASTLSTKGGDSTFAAIGTAAIGGGRGGNGTIPAGGVGGSGGGAGPVGNGGPAAGTAGQGYAGGGINTSGYGGAGGGAGGAGGTSWNGGGGNAGACVNNSYSGTTVCYAGGGGGAASASAGGATYQSSIGGGGTAYGSSNFGTNGIVILRYINYATTGTFTSAVINLGAKLAPSPTPTLSWTQTLNGGTINMQVQTSADNVAWSGYSAITNGGNITIPAAGVKYIQYKATLTSVSPYITSPTLDSVTVGYSQHAPTGNLTSSVYDSTSAANLINDITWTTGTALDPEGDETVRFQVRSGSTATPDSSWTNWCGPSTACAGTDYFTVNTGTGGLATTSPLRSGGDDRYLQYRAYLTSGGDITPTLDSVTVQYVVNGAPIVSNVTATPNSDGTVAVGYDVSDADNGNTPNAVDVTLQYCTTNCTTGSEVWVDAVTVTGDVSTGVNNGTGVAPSTGKSIVWTPTTDYATQYKPAQKIRIKANDRDAANNLGYGTSAVFTLDTKVPTTSVTLDSSGESSDIVNLNISDDTTSGLQYRLCDDAALTSCDSWTSITSGVATPVTKALVGVGGNDKVTLQAKDAYGNTTTTTAVGPANPSSFDFKDTSNVSTGDYREFISWSVFVATTSSAFSSYKVYHKIDSDPAFTLLATITDPAVNFYSHVITTATSSTHYYKVVTTDTDGDISDRTTILSDIPNGQGGSDATAPVITSAITVPPGTLKNNSAYVAFTTDEISKGTVQYRKNDGLSSWVEVPSVSYVLDHSIYLPNLTASQTYNLRVKAEDPNGNPSAYTDGPDFTTAGGPVITEVTEKDKTDNSITIEWKTSTSSDSYVYYATTVGGLSTAMPKFTATQATCISVGVCQHEVSLISLTPGTQYYYYVKSTDADGNSSTQDKDGSGNQLSFITTHDVTPPAISAISTPVLSATAAVVVWSTDEPSDSQIIWGSSADNIDHTSTIDSARTLIHVKTLSADINDLSGNPVVLTSETTYYFRVKSKDAAGNLSTSPDPTAAAPDNAPATFLTTSTGAVTVNTIVAVSVAAATPGATPDTTPPTISNVKVSDITPFGATVTFDTSEEANAFVHYGKDTAYSDAAGDDTWGTIHTIKLHGLTLGTEYHVKATSQDKSGNTGTSDDQTFKTTFLAEALDATRVDNIEAFQKEIENAIESILPSLVPPFVTKPQVTDVTENAATITFKTNIKAFPLVGYVEDGAYDTTKENPYINEVADSENKTTEHTLALTGLKPNTKYHYQARAFSLPKVIGKSDDLTFITKAAKIQGSIVERKKDSFTVVWTTDEPTSSIVEFKNVKSGVTERKVEDAMKTSHSMKVENLPSGTLYEVDISGINAQGNVVEAGSTLSVTTSRDTTPPVISGFKVDNALVPGRTDRIQTIVTWTTDEPANSTVYYEEGAGTAGDTKELANKNEVLDSYVVNHSIILPNLKSGTIYRLKVASSDDSGNEGTFGPRTVITPRQTESITDIIFKNFEDSFKFLRQI